MSETEPKPETTTVEKKPSILDRLKDAKPVAVRAGKAPSKKPRPTAKKLSTQGENNIKLLIYGVTGSGKTHFLVGLLLAGERVLVLSTDFGSNGLSTVSNAIKKLGRPELLDNLLYLDLSDYDQIVEFLEDPTSFIPDLAAFDPTVGVFEGFTSFNVDIADEYVLSLAPSMDTEKSNASGGELREEGLLTNLQDWAGIKRATSRAVRKFMSMPHPTGKRFDKIMTTLEAEAKMDKTTGEVQRGPLIQSRARDLMAPAFDVIIQAYSETDKKDKTKTAYFYRCHGASDKFVLKTRGYDLEPVEPADPQKFWAKLKSAHVSDQKA